MDQAENTNGEGRGDSLGPLAGLMALTFQPWRMEASDDGIFEAKVRIFEGDRCVCGMECYSLGILDENSSPERRHEVSLAFHRMMRDALRIVNGVNAYRGAAIQERCIEEERANATLGADGGMDDAP